MTYWEYCVRSVPDCIHSFPGGEVDVDFNGISEKLELLSRNAENRYRPGMEYVSIAAAQLIFTSIFPSDVPDFGVVRLEPEELERLRTLRIVLDAPPDEFGTVARRPYYRMRGKPVTEEQALEVIRKTDMGLSFSTRSKFEEEPICTLHFKNWWFDKHHYPAEYGWAHPDGTIGINSITDKHPTFLELLEVLLDYQKAFPVLDLIAALTWWDESPYIEPISEEICPYPNFLENIVFGVCVNSGSIEFLDKERAAERYQAYDRLYSDPDFRVYVPELCGARCRIRADEAYYQRCIAAYGSEP